MNKLCLLSRLPVDAHGGALYTWAIYLSKLRIVEALHFMNSPTEMAHAIGSGLLSFPVTHFTSSLDFDAAPYRDHIGFLLSHEPAGLFAAGGTGEFFSLTLSECEQIVRAARCVGHGYVLKRRLLVDLLPALAEAEDGRFFRSI